MKTLFAIIMSFGLLATAASAQPTVTQISNAASESLSVAGPQSGWLTLPNGSIAQGSYFTIYGNGLAANVSTCGGGYANCLWPPSFPLPNAVQGTSVSITIGNNAPVAAYIEFAAQITPTLAQVNAVLPSVTAVGSGTLTVTYNNATSAPVPITVVPSSFGIFAINQAGTGPGIITDANYKPITPFHTATPAQALILWGTGLGPAPDPSTEGSAGPCPSGCDLRGPNLSVTVWVGNQQANIAYAGRAPGYTAEDEIVITVPGGVTTGCYVSVAVQTGPPGGTQITSNFTTMAVDANGATCQDADGVNMNDIASLVGSKGSANVAALGLLSTVWNINLTGNFILWDNDTVDGQVGTYDTAALELFRGFTRVPSVNSCTAIPYSGYPPPADYGLGYVTYLDAGPSLSIQGPISTQSVAKNSTGQYDGLVGGATTANDAVVAITGEETPFYWDSASNGDGTFNLTGIASGNYTVIGPGGAAVNAFTWTLDVSSAAASFAWTNSGTFATQTGTPIIPRNTPLNITWTGGDPQGFVDITLIGSTVQNLLPSTADPEPGVYVECIVPANSGSFNVPTYVLQALPQTTVNGTPGNSDIPGFVLVGPASAVTKISPAPTGLDAAYLYYRFISGYTVNWQ